MHDLEAGLSEDALRIEGCSPALVQRGAEGMGEAAALGVAEDVELHLTDPVVELGRQIGVAVIEPFEGLGVDLLQQLGDAGGQAGVIAVVRSDHLDLVEAKLSLGLGLEGLKGRGAGERQEKRSSGHEGHQR